MGADLMACPSRDAGCGLLLLLQGFPELFRAFHQMGKERELIFLRMLPFYGVGLLVLVGAVFFPDVVPITDWWNETFGGDEKPDISKPVIGLIMLAVMLFSIFIGFPISFTLIFLGFVLAPGVPTSNSPHSLWPCKPIP